jgi:uncharacterized protein Veg
MVVAVVVGAFSPSHARATEGQETKVVRVGNEITVSNEPGRKQQARKRVHKEAAATVVRVVRPRSGRTRC